jgi:tryptophan 2,3-dioxygenase
MAENRSDDQSGGDRWEKGIHTDFSKDMSYGDYLQLEPFLAAQKPVSDQHDEMLFIILHQATELWLKLMIHELGGATRALASGDLPPAFKMLARVSRVQAQIIQSWDVLSTMTPADYLTFRDELGHSSGFQSYQYRQLEFMLGNKSRAMIRPHKHDAATTARLTEALESPTVYDQSIRLLAVAGFAIDAAVLERDWSLPHVANASVEAAWVEVYRQSTKYWELYQLAEKLIDVEDWFQQWRFRHMKTVERIIGNKTGTGGTSGVSFLKKALGHSFFPELWTVRTVL